MSFIRLYFSAVFFFLSSTANAALIFSEYVEGSSYNKALEIFNVGNTVDFNSDRYAIEIYTNGSLTPSYSMHLTGVVQNNSTFVVGNSRAGDQILSVADQLSGSLNFNGDDAIVLTQNGVIIDRIGQIGFDPGTEWGTGVTSTQDNTLRRQAEVVLGDVDAFAAFDPIMEWSGYAQNTFADLGLHSIYTVPVTDASQPVSVPAPGTFILMLAGMLGLLATQRKVPTL